MVLDKEDDRLRDISRKYKLKMHVLYTYNLTSQPKSKAVRFVYCLKGRNREKGVVEGYGGKWLAPGCFTVPIKYDKEIKEVFAYWKISYKRTVILTH